MNRTELPVNETVVAAQMAALCVPDARRVDDILSRALEMKGLDPADAGVLSMVTDENQLSKMYAAAAKVKEQIYGKRLVLFAPLYISNLCRNECTYCAFRASNKALHRRALSMEEIDRETVSLLKEGHKRVLLVAGESYPKEGFRYVLRAVEAVYAARYNNANIRRVNVNVAPLSVEEFRELKAAQIGTYQLFQETYHPATYHTVHLKGAKSDYGYRLSAIDRAMEAGIDDVGIGVLFGLHDWRFELLAMLQHVAHLERRFGVGPHTISIPRLEPASGAPLSVNPPHPVSDTDFRKLIAILRLTVPWTGIILSTRERADMRRESFSLGVSQISAGSRTNPGGYSTKEEENASQFSLGDHRPLDEVIRDVAAMGYLPSFCTACYRLGRTGADFMDLAKPGAIRHHCDPNAVSTLKEYLVDYASPQTRTVGEACIADQLPRMDEVAHKRTLAMLERVQAGQRDVFC